MTLKDFLEKHGEVEIDEEKEKQLKEILGIKEIKKSKRWKAGENEEYYYIDNWGDIDTDCWGNCKNDIFLYFTNNMFKTKEEAEFHLEKLKVYYELKNFADENNEKVRDFYCIYYDENNSEVQTMPICNDKYIGEVYFSSRELAEQAIEKIGEGRIKKYLFGVEDENN